MPDPAIRGSQKTVQVQAEARHSDGVSAIASVELVVRAGNGRIIERWTHDDFVQADADTLRLDIALRPTGPSAWTFELHVIDHNRATASAQARVERAGGRERQNR